MNMNSKRILCGFVFGLFLSNVEVLADNSCSIVMNGTGNKPVKDKNITSFGEFDTLNVEEINQSPGNEYNEYYEIVFNKNEQKLELRPTTEYNSYEENHADPLLVFKLELTCQDGTISTKVIPQPITDTNNYDPEFLKNEYTFKLPMPFTQGLDISSYGTEEILVRDFDYTQGITCTMNPPDDFEVLCSPAKDPTKKTYNVKITSKRSLKFSTKTEYTLIATDHGVPHRSGNSKLIIDVDEETYTPNPEFDDAFYVFKYDNGKNPPELATEQAIHLKDGGADMKLEILGDLSENFEANFNEDNAVVGITLNGPLDEEIFSRKSFIALKLKATYKKDETVSAKTALIIELPKKNDETTTTTCPEVTTSTTVASSPTIPCPTCEVCSTTTSCPTPHTEIPPSSSITECPITECPTTSCEPCNVTTSCPETTSPFTTITPKPTSSPTEIPSGTVCPPCSTTTASSSPNPSTSSTTVCSDPNSTSTTKSTPTSTSSNPSISSTVSLDPNLSSTTKSSQTSTSSNPNPSISSTVSSDPNLSSTTKSTETSTSSNPNPSISSTTVSSDPNSTATTKSTPTSSTPQDCPTISTTCPDCSLTTECPPIECSSTPSENCQCTTPQDCYPPTPSPGTNIYFEKDHYSFSLQPDFAGILDRIVAKTEPAETITYQLAAKQNEPVSGISIDSSDGTLKINDPLPSGIYYYYIWATGSTSGNKIRTLVVVTVSSLTICDDKPVGAYSVLVKRVQENNEPVSLLVYDPSENPNLLNEFKYEIREVYPEEGTHLFKIDDDGNLLVDTLDRELEIFKNMYVAQYRVVLELVEKSSASKTIHKRSLDGYFNQKLEEDMDECVLIKDKILNIPQTIISVIVEDINDNAPKFKNNIQNLVLGLPKEEIASKIPSTYITKIEATDADSGIRAQIRYNLDTENFIINPTTGFLYPTENSYKSDSTFNVHAIDMDGKGNKANLEIQVKLLEVNQISVIYLKNVLPDEVDAKLEELSSTVTVKALSTSVLAKTQSSTKLFRSSSDFNLKVTVYGLNSKNEPITNDEMVQIIESAEEIEIEDLNEEDNKDDIIGYIIGISLLSALVIILMGAIIALYYFKYIKPRKNSKTTIIKEEVLEVDEEIEHKFEKNRTSSATLQMDSDVNTRRATGYVFNPPPIDEDDESEILSKNNNNDEEENKQETEGNRTDDTKIDIEEHVVDRLQNKERKKSVSFFGVVEKINIEVPETEEAQQDDDSNKELGEQTHI